ncbi:MAG TPA: alpha-N-acetylglucosaminidase [Puia sp.]|nr:alpha-N-acetylglucosaminidase [Puia sp.]
MAVLMSLHQRSFAQFDVNAVQNLIKRILPLHANVFSFEKLNPEKNRDAFEIESRNNKIILRGNTGVAIASALYYYLTEFCHCQITWNGTNLNLPKQLPLPSSKIHKTSPYEYRYYLNYCTFNYSMSWWDWPRWEKEIDWMALHGINMPLAITGEEYTWREVYKQMGFTDDDLKDFFSGPAYFSWFWMGNLDGWGGPLPISWMESHKELEQKILQRERELGMKPVMPAFTGHVPAAFKKKYPNAKLKVANWKNGFADTYILDPEDPLFAEIGKKFLQTQTKLFGTDHLYSADTFNENEPSSDDPAFLSSLSKKIYQGMRDTDTSAVWVMQGWLFYSDRKFWKASQIEALLQSVPDNKMILLDLAAEIELIWKRTQAFYGKQWIWNMINNFGGNINLFGRMDVVANGPALALANDSSKNMAGIGMTMEAIEQNPVIYELMMQHVWQTDAINLDDWTKKYVRNRYGDDDKSLLNAWQILRGTAYNGKLIRDGAESILTGRPTLDSTTVWTRTKLNYDPADLLPVWKLFVEASDKHKSSDGFQFDFVDVTRQVLANYANILQRKWVAAFKEKNIPDFEKNSTEFLKLIGDMDELLSTRKDFLLGRWLEAAKINGKTVEEKILYERNARDLITLWGDANSPLHEYSCRQWSGLLNDFYRKRWEQFVNMLDRSLKENTEADFAQFEMQIRKWEWDWVNKQNDFPITTRGNSIEVSNKMYHKYYNEIIFSNQP